MANILVIDDDPDVCETMASLIGRQDHNCMTVQTLKAARLAFIKQPYDVIFLDVRLPDGNGLDLLSEISELQEQPEVIILTGKGDPDGAELAIKGGVWDYILKPSSVREITLTLNRAIRYHNEKRSARKAQELVVNNIVGKSSMIKAAVQQMGQAAHSESNLLISGETGTGKEISARTIHENSSRISGSFVVVDCAALTENQVDSMLFGYRQDEFSETQENQSGLIKLAHNGTLFLDEIGEMSLSIQKSFLRVLQERTFRPVGDSKEQHSNFRLIAATNRDLDEMVEAGTFRKDLLFRIKTITIHLPPVRQRTGDIRVLAAYKVKEICERYGMELKLISTDFFETLEHYDWPGNVREIFNIMERAVIAAGQEKKLFAMHLPRSLRIQVAKAQIKEMTGSDTFSNTLESSDIGEVRKIGQDIFQDIFDRELPSLKDFKGTAEEVYLSELIRQSNGDIKKILDISGLSRSHFYSLIKKHSLSVQTESL